jgi:excisionase family DNA binding protein
MGRPGYLRVPNLPDGPHKEFNQLLHEIHQRGGAPSCREIERRLARHYSRNTIFDAFTSTRLPRWPLVESLLEVLIGQGPKTDRQEEYWEAARDLWYRAFDESRASVDQMIASLDEVALLTPAEVADRMGVSKATVYRLARRQELPAFRVGSGLRIPEQALPPPDKPLAS